MKLYYFDTSIWINFFENRNEPNFQKGTIVRKLIEKIMMSGDNILYSNINLFEFYAFGYSRDYIYSLLKPLNPILIFVMAREKEKGIAKDLSSKRNIPKRDALHALIARNNGAILIVTDNHFQKIKDIIKPFRPQDVISF